MEKLTVKEKQLREEMKLLLRDGNHGRHFEAAKKRYTELYREDSLRRMAEALDLGDVAQTERAFQAYKKDAQKIEKIIQAISK